MENKVKEVQDYLANKGIIATETSIINAALEIACRRDLLYTLLFVDSSASTNFFVGKRTIRESARNYRGAEK
jgi:hypothetical protein